MSLSKQYPASMSIDDLKRHCPVFGDKACPFSKLPEQKKGMAGKCPAFEAGCPFKECKFVGEFEAKLGQMRDQCKGDAAYVEFLRSIHMTAKEKEAGVGTACPFFQTKSGCPFAKDTGGKPILSPDYIVTPMGVTLNDAMFKCPAFGQGVCPYADLVSECKGLAGKCPAFKKGCPFKNCKSVGEFVEKMAQMRDTCSGKDAYTKFFQEVHAVSESGQKKLGSTCPFNAHVCPFSHDAKGKAMIRKYPASMSFDDLKRQCPVFADKVCPFSKLPEEKKGMAQGKCPAFEGGCPFKECKSVGEFEDKLGEMRDQCKGDAAYVEFLRSIHVTAKEKEAGVGTACPFFQTKGGCPFAKDTSGNPILSPDYIVTPMDVTLNDAIFKCPAFGKGVCPYADLVKKCKGLAGKCPAFKEGCPFKNCKSVGEFVEKMTQMRDSCSGKAAYTKFFQRVHAVSESGQKELGGACPLNAHICPFSHDAQGKAMIPK